MVDFKKLTYTENEYVNQKNRIDVELYNEGKWKRLRSDFNIDSELQELIDESKNSKINDIDMAQKIYDVECMRNIDFELAVDVKFWSALSLELFDVYILNKGISTTDSEFSIKQAVYYNQSRSLISRHYLASLWWQTKLLENNGTVHWKSFERIQSLDSTTKNKLLESQIFRNPTNLQNLMDAILLLDERYGKNLDSKVISASISELNKLGGFVVLDIMGSDYYYGVLREVKKRK